MNTNNIEEVPINENVDFSKLILIQEYKEESAKVYKDENGFMKLFIDNNEITKDILDIKDIYVYFKNCWSYVDSNKHIHLFYNNEELTKNIITTGILFDNNTHTWFYADNSNKLIPFKR